MADENQEDFESWKKAVRLYAEMVHKLQEETIVDLSAGTVSINSDQLKQLRAIYHKFLGLEKKHEMREDEHALGRIASALYRMFKKILIFPSDWTDFHKDMFIDWIVTRFDQEVEQEEEDSV